MKFIRLFAIFILSFSTHAFASTLTSISPNSFFVGEILPHTIIVHGINLEPSSGFYRVYAANLQKNNNPHASITILDSASFPMGNVGSSLSVDSLYFVNSSSPRTIVYFTADTGTYNLIITKCNNIGYPSLFINDTLLDAVTITLPDSYIGGKIFLDQNLNKLYDAGDSIMDYSTPFCPIISTESGSDNIRFDSLGNYFFPVRAGQHRLYYGIPQPEYTLTTDSQSFSFLTTNIDILNLDFGVNKAFYLSTPDSVYQNDTVTFDIYVRGLDIPFYMTDIDVIDSAGYNIQYLTAVGSPNILQLDSNHMKFRTIINIVDTGWYDLQINTWDYPCAYTLPHSLFVMPPTINEVSESVKENISIFPVPASNLLHVELSAMLQDTKYQISNIVGKCILSGQLNFIEKTINVSELIPGLYFLKINGRSFSFTKL